MLRFIVSSFVLAMSLALCASAASAAAIPPYVAAAVADGGRPDADKQRDANRKPAETLAFAGVKPGQSVAELIPGGGYFTRLLSKVVGASGHVYALVPPQPENAPADMPDMAARVNAIAADPNYSNVSVVIGAFGKFAATHQVDVVWTSLNYHDLHSIPGLDVGEFNKAMLQALKPGGIYVILDHAAQAGSGTRDTGTLHRIDPASVKSEVVAAGFVFDGSSDVLHQETDTHTLKVFDPAIRGKTDQFILKFVKPK